MPPLNVMVFDALLADHVTLQSIARDPVVFMVAGVPVHALNEPLPTPIEPAFVLEPVS